MKPSHTVQFILAAMAVAACIAVALLIVSSHHVETPLLQTALILVAAGSYIGIGLVVAARRPANSIGLLMVAIGFAVLLSGLQAANAPEAFVAGHLGSHVVPVLLAHLLMVFPSGGFESKFQRNIIALGYLDAFILTFAATIFFDPQLRCDACPSNPLLVEANDGLHQATTIARLSIDAVVTTGLAVSLSRRWYAAVPTQRAVLAPVVGCGSVALAVFAVTFVSHASNASDAIISTLEIIALAVSTTVPFGVTFGFVRGRFTHAGAIRDLVETLTTQSNLDADLRDALVRATGDPTLEIVFWLPERRCYVDASGQVVQQSRDATNRRWHSVELNGELVAAIVCDESIAEGSDLIRTAGGAAALSLENKRLEAELRASVMELRSSRARLVEATDSERQRIERNLHDGAQQQLLSIAMALQLATIKLDDDPTAATAMFKGAAADLTLATEELRELARGIHPPILNDQGLPGALKVLAGRSPIRVEVTTVPAERFPSYVESTAYFVIAEALTNVYRYSQADRANISVVVSQDHLIIEVADDGIGGADPKNGTGLLGLADRVAVIDGRLEVFSTPGEGTRVRAFLRREHAVPEQVLSAASSVERIAVAPLDRSADTPNGEDRADQAVDGVDPLSVDQQPASGL